MAISVRKDIGSELAKMFLDDIQFQRGRYYYFLGGVSPWSGAGKEGVTDVPPGGEINLSRREEDKIRSEIIFSRYISPNDTSAVVRRIDWVSGTTYDYWDDTIDMEDKNFYVITANNRVYKCLDNGARFGGTNPSTVMPDIVSYYPFKTSDGYLWKYMYSVPAYAASRFGSVQYMPVKRAISDSFYNNGAVTDVTVLNEGSGYSDVPLTVINVKGTTTGSGAVGTITVDSLGRITGVNITNGGSNYTKGVKIKVISATGAGAKLEAVINTAGVITGVTVVQQGVGYVASDTLEFQVGNALLLPVINRSTGSIESVSIIDPGIGYVSAPTLTVFDSTSSGTGLYGNPTAILEAVEWKGSIVRVNIKDPGKNYAVDTATTITVLGDGEGAAFSPVVYDGRVVDVLVENPGSGYTDIILKVQSPTGSGAVVRGIIAQSDYESDQIVVEQTAVEGAVYKIVVTNPGAGYSPGTTITAEGDGVGLVCEPIIEAGQIKGVNIIDYGVNYTYVNFTITDPLRPTDEIPVNDRATMYAVLPPYGGHGKDAVSELLCRTVVINTPLRGEIEQYKVAQDFRIFGIIKNPTYISSGARYTNLDAYLAFRLKCIDTTAVIKDAVYIFGKEKFRVVEKTSTTVDVLPLTKVDTIPLGVFTREDDQSNQFVTTELISSYTMDKYSGKLLYFSTEIPFEFTAEQSISIKTFITF